MILVSIKDLVRGISKGLNKTFIKIDKKRIRPEKSEILRLVADSKKAKKLLNGKLNE